MKPLVLLVDDDPSLTDALKRRLRKEPYRIVEAHSGEEALKILAEQKIAVVVSDENMPGMSGTELMARIRIEHPRVMRIILTGNASLEAALKAINEGQIYRFLVKPVGKVEIMVAIRLAIEQYKLREENERLTRLVRKQQRLLDRLEREAPGITKVVRDEDGAILIDETPWDPKSAGG